MEPVHVALISTLYNFGDYYAARRPLPTRSRRSHHSLDTSPYPSRSALATRGHALASGGHCVSDGDHSPSLASVKMEPCQGAGNDGNGGGSGGGGGMFSDNSYLPATESPHSSPGGGGGHHSSQQSAYFSSSSPSSPCPTAYSAASSAAAEPMACGNHHHQAACVMRPATVPTLGCGAPVAAAVSTAMAAPAAAAAFQRDRYDATAGENPIQTRQVKTQSVIITVAPNNTQLPSIEDVGQVVQQYINHLSPKKRDKALISSERLALIKAVLRQPQSATIESAQFRFWAKKMFQLGTNKSNSQCQPEPTAVLNVTNRHKRSRRSQRNLASICR